jgi:CelD/BcsL family acetyltransferase involved in cellulose biosynthesis
VFGPELPASVIVEEITTTEALERLRPEWAHLWDRCPSATLFQSPAWLIPWWKHIGEGTLWTLALRQAGRLVGLVPFYLYTQAETGRRDIFPLGISTTDYLDAVFAPGFADCGMAAALEHLNRHRNRWDCCEWPQLRSGSPLLEAASPPGWHDERAADEPCPVLPLPVRVEDLRQYVPAHLLQNLRYYERRAEKIGPLCWEQADAGSQEDLFTALLRLHEGRWATRGESGVLARAAVQQAHRDALPELLGLGVLRLYGLRLEGRIVACYYGFLDRPGPDRRAYYYLSGFDPALGHLSLGTMILGHAIREAVREGAAAFDFLRGQEAYKYLWGAQDTPTYRRRLWHAVMTGDD